MLTIAEAAALLGMKESEVVDVADSPAGDLITTVGGTVLLNCEVPDADGKTGLMYLAAPTETYGGSFPIYAQPGAKATPSVEPGADDFDLKGASARDVLAWVDDDAERASYALAVENAREKPRKTVVAALDAILAEALDADGAGTEPQE